MKAISLAEVRARDMDRCANCGSSRDLHVHHRRLRSQGGPNTYSNQVTLCQECHSKMHANPNLANQLGFILRHGEEPELRPIQHFCWPSTLIYLRDDGSVAFWEPEEEDGDWHSIPTTDRT